LQRWRRAHICCCVMYCLPPNNWKHSNQYGGLLRTLTSTYLPNPCPQNMFTSRDLFCPTGRVWFAYDMLQDLVSSCTTYSRLFRFRCMRLDSPDSTGTRFLVFIHLSTNVIKRANCTDQGVFIVLLLKPPLVRPFSLIDMVPYLPVRLPNLDRYLTALVSRTRCCWLQRHLCFVQVLQNASLLLSYMFTSFFSPSGVFHATSPSRAIPTLTPCCCSGVCYPFTQAYVAIVVTDMTARDWRYR
jgi:hypothetical protein